MQTSLAENLRVEAGKRVELRSYDPDWMPTWAKEIEKNKGKGAAKEQASTLLIENRKKLIVNQQLLWASDTYSVLIILQGMDAAGKDSIIRHVMSGVNPQGCEVHSFKTPNQQELDHDFLWRYCKALPGRGEIGIFNRSYYEDVLIVKVRPEILQKQKLPPRTQGNSFWKNRYEDINMFEQHLVRNGTLVLKFFLNISREKQRHRLLKRLDDPNKIWKFSLTDLTEREKWKDYMEAYEEVLNETSTSWAPWYVIPANRKWVAHATISEIIASQIQALKLSYPTPTQDEIETFKKAKEKLEKE